MVAENSKLAIWLKFLNANSEEELEMVANSGNVFKEAIRRYKELINNETTRTILEAREKVLRDEALSAEENERLERAIKDYNIEIDKSLLSSGMDIGFVSKHTGLSEEETQKLK